MNYLRNYMLSLTAMAAALLAGITGVHLWIGFMRIGPGYGGPEHPVSCLGLLLSIFSLGTLVIGLLVIVVTGVHQLLCRNKLRTKEKGI